METLKNKIIKNNKTSENIDTSFINKLINEISEAHKNIFEIKPPKGFEIPKSFKINDMINLEEK